jgi:WD40 repeat protein
MPYVYGGHTSPVLDVTFLPDDNKVVSVGGNDATIFEWDVESV